MDTTNLISKIGAGFRRHGTAGTFLGVNNLFTLCWRISSTFLRLNMDGLCWRCAWWTCLLPTSSFSRLETFAMNLFIEILCMVPCHGFSGRHTLLSLLEPMPLWELSRAQGPRLLRRSKADGLPPSAGFRKPGGFSLGHTTTTLGASTASLWCGVSKPSPSTQLPQSSARYTFPIQT
jgi:hypothetical protein